MKNTTRHNTLRRGQNMLLRYWKTALTVAVSAAALSPPALAQVPPASVLRIDTVNAVAYFEDTGDVSKFATDPTCPRQWRRAKFLTGRSPSPTFRP
jgi:hypothetical protein